MSGHGVKSLLGMDDPSGTEKARRRAQSELTQQQVTAVKRTNVERDQRRQQLNRQAMAMLRARFGGSGSGGMTAGSTGATQTPAGLYGELTGR